MSLAAAIRVAHRTAAKADGTMVQLRRGDVTTMCVPALKGQHQFDTVEPDEGHLVSVAGQDFLLEPKYYDFGEGPVEPARGDVVIDHQADGPHEYELLELSGQPSWRWSDPYHTRYRVHTKEVAVP